MSGRVLLLHPHIGSSQKVVFQIVLVSVNLSTLGAHRKLFKIVLVFVNREWVTSCFCLLSPLFEFVLCCIVLCGGT